MITDNDAKQEKCGKEACNCPYDDMAVTEHLPLIEDIANMFPDEWLAFITSPEEDELIEPIYGKLVAHSPDPDKVYDSANDVLWNQNVYIFFNGGFEAMQASYNDVNEEIPT